MLANRRILSATHSAPTGLLEVLDAASAAEEMLGSGADMEFPLGDLGATTMFSSHHFRIRFWDSRWSDNCFFDHANEQVVQCKQEWRVRDPAVTRSMYVVTVKVEQSKLYAGTKVITLSPRFVLVNTLDRALKVRQWRGNLGELAKSRSSLSSNPMFSADREARQQRDRFASTRGSGIVSLNPGERVPFHWRDKSGPKQVSACFDEFGWEWSSGIQVEDCVGEFCSRLRNRHTQHVYILRVDVQVVDSTVVVTFRPELPRLPPYRVDNLSLQTIRFRQAGAPLSSAETLLPYHSCSYTWDLLDDNSRKALIVETLARTDELEGSTYGTFGEGKLLSMFLPAEGFRFSSPSTWFWARPRASRVLGTFSLDKNFGYLNSSLDQVGVSLHADGPTRVLTVSDARMPLPASAATSVSTSSEGKQSGFFQLEIALESMGVSLIEESLGEGAKLATKGSSTFTMDTPLPRQFPTTRRELLRLHLSDMHLKAGVTVEGDPVLEVSLGEVQVDNQLLQATYPVLLCSNPRAPLFLDGAIAETEASQKFLTAKLVRSNRVATLDVLKAFHLRLAPIQLNLEAEILRALLKFGASVNGTHASLTNGESPSSGSSVSAADLSSRPRSSSIGSTGSSAARKAYVEDLRIDPIEVRVNFKGALALFGPSQWFGAHVEGASLYLREFHIQHSLLSASDPIARRVLLHYMQSLRRHWYVLISSVDLLGDPIGFGKTIWGGLVDASREVARSIAWENGIEGFFRGITRGVWTLLSAAVVGFTSSVVNVCNGGSAALTSVASATFAESDFRQPRGFWEHFAQGFAGIAVLPARGYEKQGGRGFVQGSIKGIIGVVARPMAGILRLISRIAESLRTAMDPTSKVKVIRRRTPRFLRSEQPLKIFDSRRALGEEALWTVGLGSEVWVDHAFCSKHHLLVLTQTRLVVVHTSHHDHTFLGVVLSMYKIDFVIASTSEMSPNIVMMNSLPFATETSAEFRTGRYVGSGAGVTKLRSRLSAPLKRRAFRFDERPLSCDSVATAEIIVGLLNRWGSG